MYRDDRKSGRTRDSYSYGVESVFAVVRHDTAKRPARTFEHDEYGPESYNWLSAGITLGVGPFGFGADNADKHTWPARAALVFSTLSARKPNDGLIDIPDVVRENTFYQGDYVPNYLRGPYVYVFTCQVRRIAR